MPMDQTEDRITKSLLDAAPDAPTQISDISKAFARASSGRSTYGNELNAIKAGRLKEAQNLSGLFTDFSNRKLAQQRMALAEREFDFNEQKFKTQNRVKAMEGFENRFKWWGSGLSKESQADLYMYARNHERNADETPDEVLIEGIRRLGLKKADDIKLPTGYRWANAEKTEVERLPGYEGSAGGITPAQQANNAEIEAARKRVLRQVAGKTPEEIQKMTESKLDTGFDNPNFSPMLTRDLRTAMQRMVGDDPGFAEIGSIFDPPPPPIPAPIRGGPSGGLPTAQSRAPVTAPRANIETMTGPQILDYIEKAENLSPDEINRLDARLKALGG